MSQSQSRPHTVVVFTAPGCGACHREMEYLSHRGISFTERNVGTDPEALRELINLGSQGTPTTLIDEQVVIGFDRERLNHLLGLS